MDEPIILIVEDNPTLQKLIAMLAKKFGFRHQIVGDCDHLMEAISSGTRYSLIMMDWSLPGIDGLQCAAMIRARELGTAQHVPIVAMTGNAMSGDRQRCLDAGMDDYLAKPFTAEQFRSMVSRWLRTTVPVVEPAQVPMPQFESQVDAPPS
jgi:CheY-like chemotaxis protein